MIKRILIYLKETKYHVLCYQGLNFQLRGYSNADWSNDLDECKLTTRYIFSAQWRHYMKQQNITLYSLAIVQETVRLWRLLKHLDIGTDTSDPVTIYIYVCVYEFQKE